MSNANEKQVGGDHYKNMAIQPWDFVLANDIPFLEGSAIAYIARWRTKDGLKDIHKAIHFLEKLIEHETAKEQANEGKTASDS